MNLMNNLSQQIEALLFTNSDAQSFKTLANLLQVSIEEIKEAVLILEKSLEGHAMVLVQNEEEVVLATKAEHSVFIESIRKEEISKELSKASAETLAIIVYHEGISKAQIEFIRGVNVTYSLRALSVRGLVDSRSVGRAVGYYPTLHMLEHFGVSKKEDLPQYTETVSKINKLLEQEIQGE
jgi:segregation and condensation protein B